MSKPKNYYRMTQLFEKFEDAPSREITDIEVQNPEFCKNLLLTADHEIWRDVHSVSKFYINRYSQLLEIDQLPSAKFWHKDRVTRLLFYRLMERTALMIAAKNMQIGLPQKELVAFLSESCRVSERSVLRTIDQAVEAVRSISR